MARLVEQAAHGDEFLAELAARMAAESDAFLARMVEQAQRDLAALLEGRLLPGQSPVQRDLGKAASGGEPEKPERPPTGLPCALRP
jgi:hypothetical protein